MIVRKIMTDLFSKETITLNSSMTSVTSDLAVGYGKTVRIPLDTEIVPTGSGKLLVYWTFKYLFCEIVPGLI